MVLYKYKCNNCNEEFEFDLIICDRNEKLGQKCNKCNTGVLVRKFNTSEFTFDMNKKIPSDLKLFLDKQKDNAKLRSIVDDNSE